MPAPRPPRRPVTRTHHGHTFVDDYEWLRDAADPAVRDHLDAENAWTQQCTADHEPLRSALFAELKSRVQETDLSVAAWVTHHSAAGATHYWYYARTVEGLAYPIHCRVPATQRGLPPDPSREITGEQIILDENVEAAEYEFFALGACEVSPDGRLLAWSADTTGDERYALRWRDLSTGEDLATVVEQTGGSAAWAGNSHVFYTVDDAAWRPYQVLRHELGTPAEDDVVVLTEPDSRFWLGVTTSSDERWILIAATSKTSSEWHLLPVDDPQIAPQVIADRRDGVEYDADIAGDQVVIVHNANAVDFELALAPVSEPARWTTVLAGQQGRRVLSASVYAQHAVLSLRVDGQSAIWVVPRRADGTLDVDHHIGIDVDEPVRDLVVVDEPDYDTDRVRFVHTSLVTPPQVWEMNLTTRQRVLLRAQPVLDCPGWGTYDPANYVQQRLWALAADGTRIPVSLVHHRDTAIDGTAPGIVYGYGAYEIPTDPSFSTLRVSLLDRGVVFVIAHVRGGGELGRSWYEQGRLDNKMNTFTDFIDCTRFVIEESYIAADAVGALGGSAGGLLMGAAVNIAPELFTAVVAAVPFVDSLTSMLKPELPLTAIEWDEWGDPLSSAKSYRYMASYAPYENVRAVRYPAILAATSLHDTRVLVVEPAKWVAKLRETTANDDVDILLKVDMAAGHGGVSGRYDAWRQACFEYAWLLTQLGVTVVGAHTQGQP